jgi:hypothetical protein
MKSFIMSFDTAMMMDLEHKLSPPRHSLISIRALSRALSPRLNDNRKERIGAFRQEEGVHLDDLILRPERVEHVTRVEHCCQGCLVQSPFSWIASTEEDDGSHWREDGPSRIRRDMSWQVTSVDEWF